MRIGTEPNNATMPTLISGTIVSYQYGSTRATVSFRHSVLGIKRMSTIYKYTNKKLIIKTATTEYESYDYYTQLI